MNEILNYMPVEKLFSESELQDLLDMNAAPPHGQRNAALIIGAVYWGTYPIRTQLGET